MEYFADLHIHSCLSPCGDEDMTPANICGMAKLKGLDAIAICDHNSARNLPAAQELCDAYGLLLLPGMEITTREEVHLLGYFETVEAALAFGEMLRGHLPNKKNKPQFFGRQLVMNSDDEIIGEEQPGEPINLNNIYNACGAVPDMDKLRAAYIAAQSQSQEPEPQPVSNLNTARKRAIAIAEAELRAVVV